VDASDSSDRNIDVPVVCRPPDIGSDDRIFLAWQRSHMANERTFLAWSRTSISLLAFGFVIERFDIFLEHLMRLGGVTAQPAHHSQMMYMSLFCFLLAGLSVVVSGLRFLQVRRHINSGEAVYSVIPDFLVVISVFVIIVLVIILSLPRMFDIGIIPG
jgi:putative membrane protein